MRDFDPRRIASQWHSGQGSALYAYALTDRIPTETFKDRLVWEIERSMAGANDEGLDELEWLLVHVEDQHPDQFPGDEMHEAADEEEVKGSDDSDWKPGKILPKPEKKFRWEGDGMTCEACGGMTSEGPCECAMAEADREPSTYDYDNSGMSLDAKRSASAEKSRRDARKSPYDDPEWKPTAESTLRSAVRSIVAEMKLSVAGPNPFGFGGAEEMDDEDIAHFVLSKKDASKDVPAPPKSGVKAKAKAKPTKRKSKKAG